jgi:hypothetical protein
MKAVREYYRTPHDQQLQPAHISQLARSYALDRYERSQLESDLRQEHEALCDSKAEPDAPALESGLAERRRQAVDSFAQRFGISPREAVVRMRRERAESNALDMTAIDVAHRRMEAPPAPVPCPDCGSTDVPCPCEEPES